MNRDQPPEGLLAEKRNYFRIAELARLFGVTNQAIHLWIRTGRIRRFERNSKRGFYLIPHTEVSHLLELEGREVPGLWERKRVRVLLIDDDRGVREFALLAAQNPGFPMNLKAASTVEDGLLLAGEFRPDVILLDTFFSKDLLSGEEGIAFIRHAKLIRRVMTVALVDTRRIGARMMAAGADAFLLKPFSLSEFRNAIYVQWKGAKGAELPTKPVPIAGDNVDHHESSARDGART